MKDNFGEGEVCCPFTKGQDNIGLTASIEGVDFERSRSCVASWLY